MPVGDVSPWLVATAVYGLFAVGTFLPILSAVFQKVKLNPGGASFNESTHFSDKAKKQLADHYSRIAGTLGFWKNEATKYRRLHYYALLWTIPSSVLVPVLAQAVTADFWSRCLLTLVSTHTALLLSVHKALKVDANLRAFRHGESDFYDTYRRMLDTPSSFGKTEDKQIDAYFREVEQLRRLVRNAETDNLPTLEQAAKQLEPPKTDPDGDKKTTA